MSSSTTPTESSASHADRSDEHTRAQYAWRVVDIVTVAVIALAVGLIFRLWAAAWGGFQALFLAYPPGVGIFSGMFILAGPLAAYLIRKPGAAFIAEVLAAVFEAVLGSHFGITVVLSGAIQGAMAELAFALFAYRKFTVFTLLLSGLLSGLGLGVHEAIVYYSQWALSGRLIYIVLAVISGLIFGGVLTLFAHRALATAGALNAFAAGRGHAEV